MSVFQYKLANGLTILIKPIHNVPKVSLQLWYAVGSKHEMSQQRGLAHLLEHMLFKGTTRFSELDITKITHKFSGYCNAFTSCDYTAYLFDFPSKHGQVGLDILSDTMHNCTFKEELLASELKAVLQELKIYNDDYETTILEQLISLIFADHPYRYPIIGSRYDLLRVTSSTLFDFYKTYYAPNNATLVIVGDVSPDQALERVQYYFDTLRPNYIIPKKEFHFQKDIVHKSLTLYRDIQQPVLFLSWVIPGIQAKEEHIFEAICFALCRGKGSRLYQTLVHEKHKAIDVDGFIYNFFEHGLFCIRVVPLQQKYCDEIIEIIKQEVSLLINTITPAEIARASKQVATEYSFNFETTSEQASVFGEYFLALGSTDYPLRSYEHIYHQVNKKIKHMLEFYLNTSSMCYAQLLPLRDQEIKYWHTIQNELDEFDERMLSKKIRTTPLEPSHYLLDSIVKEKSIFKYPCYTQSVLKNGLTVIWYNNIYTNTVSIVLDFEVDHTYDPENAQGLCNFMFELLLEGTKQHTALQLAQKLENKGISLVMHAGKVVARCLAQDIVETLEIINEIIMYPLFEHTAIERVKKQLYSALDEYWDTPSQFIDQLAREKIYKNHPYSKNPLGTKESIKNITREKIIDFYNCYVTPVKSRLALVGCIEGHNITDVVNTIFGSWSGLSVVQPVYPKLSAPISETVIYPIDRDQVLICFVGLSVSRLSNEYNALFLFDYILTGGAQGAMASRLFSLREQTGLFYAIDGSVIAHADEQPGIIIIKATVSKSDVAKAQELIKKEIASTPSSITQDELDDAYNAAQYSLIDIFESNNAMAEVFIFLDRFNLGPNYFNVWVEELRALKVEDVQKVARKRIVVQNLITMCIGRT